MTFYIFMIILTCELMLAMSLHVVRYPGFRRGQKRWYLFAFVSIIFCIAAEFTALNFSGRGPAWALPLTWLTAVQFSLSPFLTVFFVGGLGLHRPVRIALTVFTLHMAAELVLAPFGLIFRFNENAVYTRGPLYIIYEAAFALSILFIIGSMFVIGRRFRKRDKFTIIAIPVVMLAGIIPMLVSRVYTDYAATGISAILCYIYYNDLVQQDAKAAIAENQRKISGMQEHIISALASLIESRDAEAGTVSHISDYAGTLAEAAAGDGVYAGMIDGNFISLMRKLAPMHDIGKIVVSDSILRKPGKLTDEEFEHMKVHAAEGGNIVRDVLSGITDEEYLRFASDIAKSHHERWDGTGYPEGLRGEAIPLSARIMAVADVFEALVSDRCYRGAMPAEDALEIIQAGAGSQFDPKLVRVFLDHSGEFEAIGKRGR